MWNCQIFFCSSVAWKSYLNDISLSFLFGDLSNYHLICSQTLLECLTDASVLKCPKLNLWYLFPKPVFLWVSTFQHQPHLIFPALQGQTLRIFFYTSCTLPQPILSSLLEKYIQCEFNLSHLYHCHRQIPAIIISCLECDRCLITVSFFSPCPPTTFSKVK